MFEVPAVKCSLVSPSFHVSIQRRFMMFSAGMRFLAILATVLVSSQLSISFSFASVNFRLSAAERSASFISTFCFLAFVTSYALFGVLCSCELAGFLVGQVET